MNNAHQIISAIGKQVQLMFGHRYGSAHCGTATIIAVRDGVYPGAPAPKAAVLVHEKICQEHKRMYSKEKECWEVWSCELDKNGEALIAISKNGLIGADHFDSEEAARAAYNEDRGWVSVISDQLLWTK